MSPKGTLDFQERIRLVMFALMRARFEKAAVKLARSKGEIDSEMLDADEMAPEPNDLAVA